MHNNLLHFNILKQFPSHASQIPFAPLGYCRFNFPSSSLYIVVSSSLSAFSVYSAVFKIKKGSPLAALS